MKHSFILLLLWCFILTVLYSTLSIVRHMHFQSGGFDLGLYDQAIWKFGHFLGSYNTVKERIIFGDHMVLMLPLFGILYYIWDDVRILLITQAGTIAFSAIPIFLIAKQRLNSKIAALCIAFVYSLFYGIQYGVYFDFHPIIIGTAILSWLAYFWESKKKLFFWITLVVALSTQENMGIAVFCLSFLFIFRKKHRLQAIAVAFIGIIYSVITAKVASDFSPVGYQYWPELPKTIGEVFTRLFNSTEKRQVWLYSFANVGFIPIFSMGSMLAVFFDLSQYFVTGPEFSRMWSPFMHHRAILAPFLILGTIDVLSHFKKKINMITIISIILLSISLIPQYYFHFPLNKLAKRDFWKKDPWMSDTRSLIALVPKDASVATQQNLVPHLSHRKEIYLVWPRQHDISGQPCGQSLCWWLDFGGKPEYLVVDTRPNQWLTQILESNENWKSAITNLEKVGKIKLEKQEGDAKLFRILQ